jgi:hypothetical protein
VGHGAWEMQLRYCVRKHVSRDEKLGVAQGDN